MAATYCLSLWFGVQVCDVTFPIFNIPHELLAQIALIGAIGLPITILLAWVSELGSQDIVLDYSDGDDGGIGSDVATTSQPKPPLQLSQLKIQFELYQDPDCTWQPGHAPTLPMSPMANSRVLFLVANPPSPLNQARTFSDNRTAPCVAEDMPTPFAALCDVSPYRIDNKYTRHSQ